MVTNNTQQFDVFEVYRAIIQLQSAEECQNFFEDLCTKSELDSFAERFAIAKLLHQNKTYREISHITGASTATITRVSHWLRHGKGGYRLALQQRQTP